VFYKYSLRGVPTTIFIDKDGNIIDAHVGLMKEEDLKAALDKLKS
jgi:thioredoxin-related protein